MSMMTRATGAEAGDPALSQVANQLADAARKITLPLFRSAGLVADDKAAGQDFDPVTRADREAEERMRGLLAALRPEDGILGEEFGNLAGRSGLTWVLDPIDGTRAFISGIPSWGTLIAVMDADGPIYGLIDQPFTDERFEGGRHRPASMKSRHHDGPLRTRGTAQLSAATLLSTFPEIGTAAERRAFSRCADQVRLVRYGLDCYAYALLAAGQVDLVIEAGLQSYDIAAPIAVIEAAGGVVTNWQGGPAHEGGQVLAAANPTLHAAALAVLRDGAGG